MENINVKTVTNLNNNSKSTQSNNELKTVQTRKGDYILGKTIGQGAFAKVKIATHIYTQEKVAIKILDKSILAEDEQDVCRIQKEINILKRLRHKNIIQLYEIMESSNNLYIVMDYCEGKELFDYIIKRNQLSEKKACRFFQQIINGVEYLHLQNITHRDLKPENLLLDNKENIIISDFGLSFASDHQDCLLQTPCGTPSYAPPEMLRGDKYFGIKSDTWSCGIILYTMLCGNLPCAESKEELIYKCFYNRSYDYPNHLSTSVVDLIKKLLKFNPEERLEFDQIKKHPWFNLVRPQMKPGIIVNIQKIPVDESILNKVETFGYDREECRESVLQNKYDHLCAIYYLILKQFMREGKPSISDMNSELYDNYIRNKNNWEHLEEFKDIKYKDYWPEQRSRVIVIHNINSIASPKTNIVQQKENQEIDSQDYQLHLTKSSSQGDQLNKENHYIEEINTSIKLTETNTSINSFNHPPISVSLCNETNNNQIKQTTFTSSKSKRKTTSHYSHSNQNKTPLIHLNANPIDAMNKKKECINDSIKQSLLLNLQKKISSFNHDIKLIDSFNWDNSNIIPSIATKLIKTTIFSKYLLNKRHNRSYKDELEEKFYKLQKYKELVETIKTTRKNIFSKKILDWNYYTFEIFLNDKEDLIFNHAYNKSNPNSILIKKIKKSIKFDKQLSSIKFVTKHSLSRSVDPPNFKNSLFIYSSNKKRNIKDNRMNRFIVSPRHFLKDYSNTRFDSNSKSIYRGSRENSLRFPTCMSNYSSSSMNNISEDEELINDNEYKYKTKKIIIGKEREPLNFFNNKFDIKPRKKHEYKLKMNMESFNNANSPYFPHKEKSIFGNKDFNQLIGITKSPYCNKRNSYSNIFSDNSSSALLEQHNQNNNMRQITLTSKQKEKQNISLFPQVNLFKDNDNDNDNDNEDEYYNGPIVDCRCVFQSSRNALLPLLKQYFKQHNYFCNHIDEYKIKCYKANTQFEFQLLKLKEIGMTYIKFKKNKGNNSEFAKIVKGLINSFPFNQ